MALAAQGDQLVAVEVRAALGALPEVMHFQAVRGETVGLAPPTGSIRTDHREPLALTLGSSKVLDAAPTLGARSARSDPPNP